MSSILKLNIVMKDRYRLMTLHMAGLLRLDEGSEPELQDISKLRWEWVHAWMAECASEAHHKTCSKALQAIEATSWFPTRIVDVREKLDDDGRKRYMLLETATTAPEGHRYATLSHIWGSEQQPAYRTLRVNYEARLRDGISRDILPPCFQDAIDVAARLKIPYIWIDSLCIIQDDPVDGPTEAGSMDKVYTNSFLNLSATASSSSKDRLPSVAKNDRLQEPRFTGTNWTRRYKGVYQIFDPHFWADRVTQTRLASRGWIFQERALAPRVLHFGFDQLLWECPESERAEEFPLGIPEHLVNNYRRGFKWHMNTSSLQDDGDDDSAATGEAIANDEQQRLLHQKWATITASYTRCELTRATDKLVAISGVAQVLAHRFSDTYLAGLWSSNLIGGLCWQVPKMRRTTQNLVPSGLYARRWEISRRLADNNAPSWSWASVDGEVETGPFVADETEPFQLKNGQEGYKIVRSLVTTAPSITVVPKTTKNSFGEVDTQRTRLQLHVNIMFALEAKASESRLEKQLSLFEFYYAGTTQTAAIKLDQPEELDSVQDALFIPLVLVQTHIYALANVTKVSHEGDVDFNLVMGIVVVPAGFSSSGAVHRRIGFHQCPLDVLSASGLVSLEGVVQLG